MKTKRPVILIFLVFIVAGTQAQNRIDSLQHMLDSSIIDKNQTEILINLAEELHILDLSNGLRYATNALTNAQLLNSEDLIGRSRLILGRYYLLMGLYQGALLQTRSALDIFTVEKDDANRIMAVKQIGDIYLYSQEFSLALKYFDQSYQFAMEHRDSTLMISTMLLRGAVYGNISRMDSALAIFRRAAKWSLKIGDREQELLCMYNIGDVLLYSGSPKKALNHFLYIDSTYQFDNLGYRHRSGLYNSLTHAYIDLGSYEKAEYYNKKAYEKLQNNMRFIDMRDYYNFRFMLDTIAGDYKSAILSHFEMDVLNDTLSAIKFRNQLANFETLFKFQEKERHIETLTRENELKEMEIKNGKNVIFGSIGLLILLTSLVIQFRISSRRRKQQYDLLQEQKVSLEAASKEIQSKSGELQNKNIELERLLKELQSTQQQMIQSEKMASLGVLTAGVAHEINNPLNFISGGVVVLRQILEELKEVKVEQDFIDRFEEAAQIVDKGLDRASTIVKALNTFSRTSSENKTECSLDDLINNLLLFLKSRLRKDIKVIKDLQPVDHVLVYPDKMHQVILNILDNAIDACVEKNEGERVIKISNSMHDKQLEIVIENTGPNIEAENLAKLFDPFFTTKAPGHGTGLGLSIAYRLVEDHGGLIYAENISEGVRFVIRIPV